MVDAATFAERVGQEVATWRLVRLIGVGASAGVFEAHRTTDVGHERAAIKLLHPRFSSDVQLKQRFLREAKLAATLDHPGLGRVHTSGLTERGDAYLVMELLEGQSVEALRLERGGRLESSVCEDLARQVLAALAAMHEQGVLHRDIKPANLFMTREGLVKVLDFGIARSLEAAATGSGTATGALLGTPAFMAPEQARGRHELVDARTDLWALGATLFTLLTGRFVHVAETSNELLGLAMSTAAPRLSRLLPDLPPGLCRVIDRALEYDAAKRFPSALSMLRALGDPNLSEPGADTANATALTTKAEGTPAPQKRRVVVPLLIAFAALSSGGLIWARWPAAAPAAPASSQTTLSASGPIPVQADLAASLAQPPSKTATAPAVALPIASASPPPSASVVSRSMPQPLPGRSPPTKPVASDRPRAGSRAPAASASFPESAAPAAPATPNDRLLDRRH